MRDPEDPHGGLVDQWTDVIHKPCPDCGAEIGDRCTFLVERTSPEGLVTVRIQRHMPCLRRIVERNEP